MRIRILLFAISLPLFLSCGGGSKDADTTADAASSTETIAEKKAPLSSIENPLKPGDIFETSGWSNMRVELIGLASSRIANIYASEFDPNLDYVVAEFRGTNRNGKKTNMYATMSACKPGGTVGANGVFRQLVMGSTYENELSGLQLITTGDNEVLDGFESTGLALYPIERGDNAAFIMSQSEHCGYDHDLVIAIGNVSKLPVLP
jgi:hypothetical protein